MKTDTDINISYHASHEQFSPSELLSFSIRAKTAGFDSIHCSDHFFPWSEKQGQSGYSFAWLGAAMQAVDLPFGMVCCPAGRYHPAIVAQAIATLTEMFPQRLWVALGSGEALNESITGEIWPEKKVRNQRLFEAANIIKRLLQGETVASDGLIKVVNAKLYTRPTKVPLLIGAALTKETAAWMGSWADGLITVPQPLDKLKELIDAFRQNGGEAKPLFLKIPIAYAESEEVALNEAYQQWRNNIFQASVLGELRTVAQFDALGEMVKPEDLYAKVRISANLAQHLEWIQQDIEMGFNNIILHQVCRDQDLFIKAFGQEVLPKLKLHAEKGIGSSGAKQWSVSWP